MQNEKLLSGLEQTVRTALEEDVGSGDISAAMIPADENARARVICREQAVICGRPWAEEVFRQIDPAITLEWKIGDGDGCEANDLIVNVSGPAAGILTGERTALNFLQVLSGTATRARTFADLVAHTGVRILDTRKTLPGLRLAQKYAVASGGCHNHRLGLYDAVLIKENHISACGGIKNAVEHAKKMHGDNTIEVEVESLAQLKTALGTGVDMIMLDNFTLEDLEQAVSLTKGKAELEASGGYDEDSVVAVAETGVDYISVGRLTKSCAAIDFSMRFV